MIKKNFLKGDLVEQEGKNTATNYTLLNICNHRVYVLIDSNVDYYGLYIYLKHEFLNGVNIPTSEQLQNIFLNKRNNKLLHGTAYSQFNTMQ